MDKSVIKRLMIQSGLDLYPGCQGKGLDNLVRFAELVADHERRRCVEPWHDMDEFGGEENGMNKQEKSI